MDRFTEILKLQAQFTKLRQEYWLNHILFSYQWWLLLLGFIALWVLWWLLVDKRRLLEVSLFGVSIMVLSSIADEVGTSYGFWDYPFLLIFPIPNSFVANLALFPVTFMLVYQWFPKWKSYLVALAIVAAALALIIEPVAEGLGFYTTIKWKHYYSFPAHFLFPSLVKAVVDKVVTVSSIRD